MAENKGMHIENLKQAGELLKSGKLDELVKSKYPSFSITP